MFDSFKSNIYGIWLGGSITMCSNISFMDWKFYVIIVPTIIFVNLFNKNYQKEEKEIKGI